ncbi:ABC transporter substrate-binding protein [Amycolatopsis albispora]|uniref:Sulfonate ABC transporter substrate-binding protein n=1 Tax=Amycolatopsis albispora TaxID=1804986 RepID=A0A344LBU6_9PSEU|nr:ABC transporter substrate-binding protein [Amycolatopsis albispora]AXB45520.1 sulfonate ABC transporter substrate-binding protein [Amycolatopsis albispora]
MGTGAGRAFPALLIVALVVALSGCSAFDQNQQATPAAPERNTLRVGVGNPIESAPLRMAVADGSFTAGGLKVELIEQANAGDGLAKLAAGDLDVAFGSDVDLFKAAGNGVALQLQGEAYTAGTDTMALVTLPDSAYSTPTAKRSPTIAVDALDGLGTLTSRSVLATAGVDVNRIRFTQRGADEMMSTLRDGEADAAWLVEPQITMAQQEFGAKVLADTARGATLEFPVSAYAANAVFAQANPRTMALFRALLGQAQQKAADPAIVRQALPSFAGISANTAALVSLGSYPSSLSGVRLQRVADLMHGAGVLKQRLDVQALLPAP